MREYAGVQVQLYSFLISLLDRGVWSALRFWLLCSLGKIPLYQLHRSLGGPLSPSGLLGEDTHSFPCLEPHRNSSSVLPDSLFTKPTDTSQFIGTLCKLSNNIHMQRIYLQMCAFALLLTCRAKMTESDHSSYKALHLAGRCQIN